MAGFITSLWEAVFTPGPTPPLLLATNATFGTLQVLLIALFAATHSFHFVALSFICGGLWWAINWFASELARAKATEDKADRIRRRQSGLAAEAAAAGAGGEGAGSSGGAAAGGAGAGEDQRLLPPRLSDELAAAAGGAESGMDTGDDIEDTDTETELERPPRRSAQSHRARTRQQRKSELLVDLETSHSSLGSTAEDEDELSPAAAAAPAALSSSSAGATGAERRLAPQDAEAVKRRRSAMEMSGTDSEWEKVENER